MHGAWTKATVSWSGEAWETFEEEGRFVQVHLAPKMASTLMDGTANVV